jgi:hypothetical protein
MTLEQIEHEALALSTEDRAILAQKLLLSLEEASEPEFDRLWGEESIRRIARFDASLKPAISGEDVARKSRALCRVLSGPF